MNNGVRHVSESLRRTIVAAAFAVTIIAAFATASAFAVITAPLPPIGTHAFVPSGQEDTPLRASQVRGCVVQDPNGDRRGWLPGASPITGPQRHTKFSHASICITLFPMGPGAVWVPHLPGTVVNTP
jgi:hypothetical protein